MAGELTYISYRSQKLDDKAYYSNLVNGGSGNEASPFSNYLLKTGDTATGSYIFDTSTFVIDATNHRVGIGNASPRALFDVISGNPNTDVDLVSVGSFTGPYVSGNTGILVIQSNDTQAAGKGGSIGFAGRYTSTNQATFAKIDGWKEDSTAGNYGGGMSFYTRVHGGSLTERMRIQPNGNVGIGTDTPLNKLHINDTGSAYIRISSSNNDNYIILGATGIKNRIYSRKISDDSAFPFAITQGDSDNFCLSVTGNIGIGNANDTYKLDVTGTGYFNGYLYAGSHVGSTTYASGFAGSGWQMYNAGGDITLTVDNLVVRKALTAYELDINKINSVNGGIIISVANGTVMTVSGTTFYMDEDDSNKEIQFQVNDYVRAQVYTGRGIATYIGLVTAVNHSTTYGSANIVCTTISGTPYDGMELVQIGNTSNAARQNLIYITAADTNNPYIDMLANVNAGNFTNKQKVRIGNLTGITDAVFGGALSGYGLYADNVYLKGSITITSGSVPNTVVTGLGSLATKSSVDLSTGDVTNKSLANVDSTANTKLGTIQSGADVTSSHTAAAISGQGALATLNSVDFGTQVTGSTKPENNATVGAAWSTNLSGIPVPLTTPTGTGLFLSSTYLGFYTSSAWKVYIDNAGNFSLGDAIHNNTGLYWNQSAGTLKIVGDIAASTGTIGGWSIGSNYLESNTSGQRIVLSSASNSMTFYGLVDTDYINMSADSLGPFFSLSSGSYLTKIYPWGTSIAYSTTLLFSASVLYGGQLTVTMKGLPAGTPGSPFLMVDESTGIIYTTKIMKAAYDSSHYVLAQGFSTYSHIQAPNLRTTSTVDIVESGAQWKQLWMNINTGTIARGA